MTAFRDLNEHTEVHAYQREVQPTLSRGCSAKAAPMLLERIKRQREEAKRNICHVDKKYG